MIFGETTKITAIIPTLNEEIHFQAATDSVSFANEIIVIDLFRTFYFLEKKQKYIGWPRDKVIRLFNRYFYKYDGK